MVKYKQQCRWTEVKIHQAYIFDIKLVKTFKYFPQPSIKSYNDVSFSFKKKKKKNQMQNFYKKLFPRNN